MASVKGSFNCLLTPLPLTENSLSERLNVFLSGVAQKNESASVHCHPTARAPFMKRAVLSLEDSPDLLIATQSIIGRTEKFIRFLGCISSIDANGRTICTADAHRSDGKCFVVRADEKVDCFCRT